MCEEVGISGAYEALGMPENGLQNLNSGVLSLNPSSDREKD